MTDTNQVRRGKLAAYFDKSKGEDERQKKISEKAVIQYLDEITDVLVNEDFGSRDFILKTCSKYYLEKWYGQSRARIERWTPKANQP